MENRIKLTQRQTELVDKLNELLKKMKSEGIQIVYDRAEQSFAAINSKKIKELQVGYEPNDTAVYIECDVQWGNIHEECFFEYNSYYGDLYAVFDN